MERRFGRDHCHRQTRRLWRAFRLQPRSRSSMAHRQLTDAYGGKSEEQLARDGAPQSFLPPANALHDGEKAPFYRLDRARSGVQG